MKLLGSEGSKPKKDSSQLHQKSGRILGEREIFMEDGKAIFVVEKEVKRVQSKGLPTDKPISLCCHWFTVRTLLDPKKLLR